jgi:hypothetical protein
MDNDGRRDFDFLHGKWRIDNRRLAKRLAGSTEWLEFEARGHCWKTIDNCNVDTFVTERSWTGARFEGMTVRVFNPTTRLWSIYWADARGALDAGVTGRWTGETGTFFGDDELDGRRLRCRFIWKRLGQGRASWQQAFSVDGEKSWETNWYMDFTRE